MPAPSAPTDFVVAGQGFSLRPGKDGTRSSYNRGAVRLTFTAVTSTAFHTVQIKTGSGGWVDAAQAPAGVASVEIYGLSPNTTTHRFQIRAENSAGEVSAWMALNGGDPITVPPLPTLDTQINPPGGLNVVADAREAVFTWTDNANNEARYELFIEDPSQPIGSLSRSINVEVGYESNPTAGTEREHSLYGTYTVPIGDNAWLKHNKTYRAKVRAVGFKSNYAQLFTDYSAEDEFTTPAPAMGITNFPLTIKALKGQPIDFQILTNGPATTFAVTVGTLPAGLTLNATSGIISGVATAAGSATVTIQAGNGSTTDSRVFTVQLLDSSVYAAPASPTPWIANPFTQSVPATITAPFGNAQFSPFRHILTGDTTNASPTISKINTAKLALGMLIEHANFAAGTAITALTATTVTASANAGATTADATITFRNAGSYAVDGGSLPDGLALDVDTGVISGTPTSVGLFSALIAVKLKHGNTVVTSTRARYEFNVERPSVIPEVDTGAGFTRPEYLGLVSAPYAEAINWPVRGVGLGPVGSLSAPIVTLDNEPTWLGVTGAALTGTPSEVGVWDVSITVGNGTYEGSAVLRVEVKPLEISSDPVLEVYQGQTFSFTPTSRPSGATMTIAGVVPEGVEADATLSGAATEIGDFPLTITATLEGQTDKQDFTLRVLSIIRTVSESFETYEGEPVFQPVEFLGDGVIQQWALSGAPAGLTITPITGYEANPLKAIIGGMPAENSAGIYDVTIIAVIQRDNDEYEIHRKTVTVTAEGGLFLGWFHDNPHRLDLQLFPRTREVKSYYADATNLLELRRGDEQTLHLIVRDRRSTILPPTDFSEVFVTIRPLNDFDGEPLLAIGGAVCDAIDVETIGSKSVMKFVFDVTSDAIERGFDSLNQAPGGDPNSARLLGHLEVSYKLVAGGKHTTEVYSVLILQDFDR